MTRTFYCKSVDEEQAKIHDIVRTAVLKAEEVIKPGIPVCDIDKQARDYIDEMGYTKYWGVRLGHFIGQDDHEFGDVSQLTTIRLLSATSSPSNRESTSKENSAFV